jgi:hypothetical protein
LSSKEHIKAYCELHEVPRIRTEKFQLAPGEATYTPRWIFYSITLIITEKSR